MFSTTTTASSITRPMATARPPIDIRLIDPPKIRMKTNVGIDGQRQRQRRHEREPQVAQEDEQHDDREQAADEDGVAHVGDRALTNSARS